ncbi:hypothetical protein [Elizabethkingia ursingii]|uniref:Uncharacterized protein n=1 Tax=Elizabethkingia ursingii TaxID=1756150 RepID=A0AAJ3NAN3_9FLAO|nr:hypothetical protein [Elizabethkingia ursingii]AQX08043.1 hypothetical protein BBD34_05010 [Elizabethkingia ursingii]OPB73603.1 hypothetical protein BAY32_11210 [Elizabethkingia ursingii]
MKQKIHVKTDFDDVELRYTTWLKMVLDLMGPKNAFLVLGRATTKTTDFQAERSMDVCYDMPTSYLGFVADTYTNLLKNVVPAFIEGWNRKGWREGTHYVIDEPPPSHFKLPYKAPTTYKHTISTHLGNLFNYISMDTPSSGAGNSYQHLFGDEAKYLEKKRIDKLFPALRGDATLFGHSPFYMGVTFTTDHPNLLMPGEHEWIMDREKDMNKEQMMYLLQISLELNEKRADLINTSRKRNNPLIKKLEKEIQKLAILHTRLRFNSTFFYVASSFVNMDLLTLDFFKTALASLGEEDFNTSVLSFKPTVESGQKFYVALDPEKHIYDDGIVKDWHYKFSLGDAAEVDSSALKYCDPNKPLEIGIDFGDMISFVIGQSKGRLDYYLLKNIFITADKGGSREICDDFIEFFKPHKKKVLEMYYDRSGNQYQKVKRDWANEIKTFIERDSNNIPTGWKVELKSRGQGNIEQQTEFQLVNAMLQQTYFGLPRLHIDKYQCKQLISSMGVAKQIIKSNAKGVRQIFKDKSSEKLPLAKRPMFSTNMSDGAKYLLCRKEWLEKLRDVDKQEWSAPDVLD